MARVERTLDKEVYRPGETIAVTVHVVPDSNVLAYALEEQPPVGWAVSEWNQNGNFTGGLIKWGVFFDNQERKFTYQVISAGTEDGLFSGRISFNGSSEAIGGRTRISLDDISPKSPE